MSILDFTPGRHRTGRSPRPVTALRKDGRLDEAYELARAQAQSPTADEWDMRDLAWCLIDLVKRHSTEGDQSNLRSYLSQLAELKIPADDNLLLEHCERALALVNEDRRAVMTARKRGKDGHHEEAIRLYADLLGKGCLEKDDKLAFGWELYRATQAIFRASAGQDMLPRTVDGIKRHLNTYLKLGVAEPGTLHSLMMQQATRLAHGDHLRLAAFARLWDLDLFRDEDFRETRLDDGKIFPPLAETVFQRSSKEAAAGGSPAEMNYILPHLERGLKRFPENIWLKLNKVKLLRGLGRGDEARQLATEFARGKAGEYWTWELLGDLEIEPAMRLSCYAKALTCQVDETFVGKLRLKFAAMVASDYPGVAKSEVERVIEHRRREGTRLPAEAQRMLDSAWYRSATPSPSGAQFYDQFKHQAEELLFAHLPWTLATVGDEFVIEGRDGKKDRPRRRILVKNSPLPLEISVSASHPDIKRCSPGTPIAVQIETSPAEPWKTIVHRIQPRDGGNDDVVPELCGVIDHINKAKSIVHFVVSKSIDGTFPLSEFSGKPEIGQPVAVRMTRSHSQKGMRTRTLSASSTSRLPEPDIMKSFDEHVEVRNGLGFTSAGIFIPPDIVSKSKLEDGDRARGMAVINFDKRKNAWGWKAICAE